MRTDALQATEAFSLTYSFIKSLLANDRSPVEPEWLMLVNLAQLLCEHGSANQKRLYARTLYDGAEALRESNNTHGKLNAAKLDNIQVNFRIWCKPLLDTLDSFLQEANENTTSGASPAA